MMGNVGSTPIKNLSALPASSSFGHSLGSGLTGPTDLGWSLGQGSLVFGSTGEICGTAGGEINGDH